MNENLLKAEELMQKALIAYHNGNFEQGDLLRQKSNELFDLDKDDIDITQNNINSLYGENKNFGIIHKVFENNSPELYKTKDGRKIIASYIKTIKEDKNLLSQFQLYNTLYNVHDLNDSDKFVNEALGITPNLKFNDILTSNQKLINIIQDNNLNEDIEIDTKTEKLYESIEFILTNKKTFKTLANYMNATSQITSFINENKMTQSEETIKNADNIDNTLDNFMCEMDEKYGNVLTEEEKTFVQEIVDAKADSKNDKQRKIFTKCKNEALEVINSVLQETEGNAKEKLLSIKERVLNREFNESSLIKDVAEMMEIKDTLSE